MEALTDAIKNFFPRGTMPFVEDVTGEGCHTFALSSKCEPGAIGARPGYFCPSCGAIAFPDSPLGYTPKHPGDGENEEVLEDVETPGANTIAELCDQLGIGVTRTIKAMLYVALDKGPTRHAVASFVRGDYNLSMAKLSRWLAAERGLTGLRSADKAELHELVGEVAGYCGPVGMPLNVVIVCDDSVKGSKNMVVGANHPGYHKKGCCHPRDFDPPMADIAQATEGTPCGCGGRYETCAIRESGKIGIGHAADLAGKNLKPLSYRDRDGTHDYPASIFGNISIESVMLAGHLQIPE
jgi:prolyl-tRNA synthetase